MDRRIVLPLLCALACNSTERHAYRLTEKDLAALALTGDTVAARAGDIVMRSSKAIAVIQRPLRDMGPAPYGGTLIDFALADDRIDRFGEVQPFLNMGRTASFTEVDIVSDGSDGGAIVVEARGKDALIDFINVPAVRPDLLAYNPDGSGLLKWDPNAPIPASYTARYTLEPDGDTVNIRYTIQNESDDELALQAGISIDAGGAVAFFTHERGYDASIGGFSLAAFQTGNSATAYSAIAGEDVAYGLRPLGDRSGRPLRSVGVSIAGVVALVPSDGTLLDVVSNSNVTVAARGERSYVFEVQLGKNVTDVRRRFLERDDTERVVLSGSVLGLLGAGPHHAYVLRDGEKVDSEQPLDADGRFSATVPKGRYKVVIDTTSLAPVESPLVDVDADLDLTIDAGRYGTLAIRGEIRPDRDSVAAADRPCRVTIFAAAARAPFPVARRREVPSSAFDVRFLPHCSTAETPLALPEGTYLVQTTAGPQYDVHRALLQISADAPATLTPVVHRVFSPVVAADFHQHSINSPDSSVPLELRTLGYAAEGIDFFASSDHDRVTDYAPLIASLGLEAILQTAPGVECTSFVYGHFNAWPLPVIKELPSGGSIDWGRETDTLLPREIFKTMRERGAAIVQVNHPRDSDGKDFQSFFDRAALVVDPDTKTMASDPMQQLVPNELLRLPPGEPLFDRDFDVVELLNGFPFRSDEDGDGYQEERRADLTLRDWLGFLAQGFRPTIVGVSDSHSGLTGIAGYPRTYVLSAASDAESVASALKSGRAIASNGPLLDVRATGKDTAGIGQLVRTNDDGSVSLVIRTEAQTKDAIDRFEGYVNTWVRTAPGMKRPLVATFSVDVVAVPQTVPNGGVVWTAEATVPLTVTKDAFVVVRARGRAPLFPFLPQTGSGTVRAGATTPETFFEAVRGAPALVYANPVYLDFDGDGAFKQPAF